MTPTSEHNTPTSTHVQKHTVPHNVQIPDKWTQTADQYDSNTNLGGPVFKHIQPSAWSRRRGIQGQDPLTLPASSLIRYGCEDHAFRLLSQGKFIGLVPTRTVAESVFLSQLVKALRDQNIDLDSAAEGTHKGPMPNKQTEPIKYMTPLVQCIIKEIKSKEPVQTHLAQVQKLASTEAQLAKAQHKLQQHGIQITPQRKTSTTPALPTESQDNTQGSQRSPEDPTPPTQPEQPDQPEQPHQEEPPAKRPRKAKAKAGKEQEKNPTDLPMILHPTTSNNSHLGRQPSKQPHRHKGDTVDWWHQQLVNQLRWSNRASMLTEEHVSLTAVIRWSQRTVVKPWHHVGCKSTHGGHIAQMATPLPAHTPLPATPATPPSILTQHWHDTSQQTSKPPSSEE